MNALRIVLLFFLAQIGVGVGSVGVSNASETHAIEATSDLTWKSADGESEPGNPLVVNVNKGDILEISVPNDAGSHGFVTTEKNGTTGALQPAPHLVWACGQPESEETKKAVLREVECGAKSNFNKIYIGEMKLEVTNNIGGDVSFWCFKHTSLMPGLIKLKPQTP
jgi:hypothetical protein